MKNSRFRRRVITPAQRGQIIQRVIVDGWESADAAASVGVPKRLVNLWVADFRRNGMASLRRDPGFTIAAEIVQLTISRPVQAMLRNIAVGLRRLLAANPQVQPVPLRHSHTDGPR
jgi:transposase-like protein